jgi:hypothetical protein
MCKDCLSFPSFEAAIFVPREDLSLLKCECKTRSLITAVPLRERERAIAAAEEKAGYNYSTPHFKEALENEVDKIYKTNSVITGDNGGKSFIPGKLKTRGFKFAEM